MIKTGQQFKVESVEELKKAYKHLDFYYSLEDEINDFNKKGIRFVMKDKAYGFITLNHYSKGYETIPNPLKEINQPELKGIDKIMDDLSSEAKKLGFAVEVVFKNLDK